MCEYCPTVSRTLGPVGVGEAVGDVAETVGPADVAEELENEGDFASTLGATYW